MMVGIYNLVYQPTNRVWQVLYGKRLIIDFTEEYNAKRWALNNDKKF